MLKNRDGAKDQLEGHGWTRWTRWTGCSFVPDQGELDKNVVVLLLYIEYTRIDIRSLWFATEEDPK